MTTTIEPQSCGSATPATIEQRIAELRSMERNMAEFRAKLTDDLHALGITWLDGAVVADEPKQPVITDWRDLRVGDVIWFGECKDSNLPVGEYTISVINGASVYPIAVMHDGANCWTNIGNREWRFIRRP